MNYLLNHNFSTTNCQIIHFLKLPILKNKKYFLLRSFKIRGEIYLKGTVNCNIKLLIIFFYYLQLIFTINLPKILCMGPGVTENYFQSACIRQPLLSIAMGCIHTGANKIYIFQAIYFITFKLFFVPQSMLKTWNI